MRVDTFSCAVAGRCEAIAVHYNNSVLTLGFLSGLLSNNNDDIEHLFRTETESTYQDENV